MAEQFGIPAGQRVAVAEIDLKALFDTGLSDVELRPVSRYQPVEQDFAVVVDEAVPADAVEAALRAGAGPLATSVRLFDIYRGPAIDAGKKSLAYRVTLSAPDRELSENEIQRIRGRIERQLARQVSGTLRG